MPSFVAPVTPVRRLRYMPSPTFPGLPTSGALRVVPNERMQQNSVSVVTESFSDYSRSRPECIPGFRNDNFDCFTPSPIFESRPDCIPGFRNDNFNCFTPSPVVKPGCYTPQPIDEYMSLFSPIQNSKRFVTSPNSPSTPTFDNSFNVLGLFSPLTKKFEKVTISPLNKVFSTPKKRVLGLFTLEPTPKSLYPDTPVSRYIPGPEGRWRYYTTPPKVPRPVFKQTMETPSTPDAGFDMPSETKSTPNSPCEEYRARHSPRQNSERPKQPIFVIEEKSIVPPTKKVFVSRISVLTSRVSKPVILADSKTARRPRTTSQQPLVVPTSRKSSVSSSKPLVTAKASKSKPRWRV
ncbi:hypothetical protein FPQ18DRAFT_392304 [Pyronema domesticum]|nr:hypothetical protein FPQ18DRAFT_392304 [Pyronema domesticum]